MFVLLISILLLGLIDLCAPQNHSEFKKRVKRTDFDSIGRSVAKSSCTEEEKDCKGVCFGTAKIDKCGTCGGSNEACTDCNGDIFGTAKWDCGQCIGGNTGFPSKSRKDCMGNCFGTAVTDDLGKCCNRMDVDKCGVCYGTDKCLDCNGDVNGTAFFDDCGSCAGGKTKIRPNSDKDCHGVCFGAARLDDCNVCSGGQTGNTPNGNKDCKGVCFGAAKLDVCGVCDGDGSSCLYCDGRPNSGAQKDQCGVCKGDNSTCCGPFGNCNNKGICKSTNNGECDCDLGWTGKYCTNKADLCRWQDCGGKGTCSRMTGECICDQGYMGDHCEYPTCSFHGIVDPDHGGVCNCFPGYTGLDCSKCGSPSIKNAMYVCVSNYDQNVDKMSVDEQRSYSDSESTTIVANPIRFTMMALSKPTAVRVLIGDHPLTIKDGTIAILPGTSLNGTVYGCDCKPAVAKHIPEEQESQQERNQEGGEGEDLQDREGEKVDEYDALYIRDNLKTIPREEMYNNVDKYIKRYTTFQSGGIRHLKRHHTERALTANQANTFLNQLFDFFNEEADAFTDTPETVGRAIDNIEDAVEDQQTATIVYFAVVVGIIFVLITTAIISIILVTGGIITNPPRQYESYGYEGDGYEGGYEGSYE